ncbi:PaaI family thioesterase [Sphingomicrobium clamense]|uniref:PaaI family thioesterase n=1 Tax=Sphingomicrobium clamense TaxID=2851013 RepID=A0ABS6V4M3_9SPHN|nr:PaaI family thioesterase [Sphingomicrobium sp. B8]MBW0144512.1 PaaI family thioesterase [Sphingomicrobium sp. B8]
MTLPPYAKLLDIRAERSDGALRFVLPFGDDVMGRPGFLHGGAIAGLLELTAFETLKAAIEENGVKMKPVTVTVDYMRGGASRDTYCEGVIERLGRRMANVDVIAWQKDRATPIATARMNFLLDRSQAG